MALKRYDEVLGSCDAYLARETADRRDPGDPRPGPGRPAGLLRRDRRLHPGPRAAARPRARRRGPGCSTTAAGPTTSPTPPGWPWTTSRRRCGWSTEQGDALAGRGLARVRLGDWRPAVADAEAAVRLAQAAPAGRATAPTPAARPTSTPPGSTPRPSSSPPPRSPARASAACPSTAPTAPAPSTCSSRPSRRPPRTSGPGSWTTPR